MHTFWNESTYLLKPRVVKSENVNCPEQAHWFSTVLSFELLPIFGISLLFMAGWERFIGLEGEDTHTSAHGRT